MEENTQHTENAELTEEVSSEYSPTIESGKWSFLLPVITSVLMLIGIITNVESKSFDKEYGIDRYNPYPDKFTLDTALLPDLEPAALISPEHYSSNLRDTMYTHLDKWLELRVDQQKLYVHYKDGRVKTCLVSTGNKFSSKGVETRPGIYAIFLKEEVHLSSQFNNARMNYYMPFNMGIGFHGLPGTGYYGFLGVRPSSHGCIRMRNDDVKTLFNECPVGMLVLAHSGNTARVVAFAPEGFVNDREYSEKDYMRMLAYNMNAIYEGKYLFHSPKRFILDGKKIPRIGFNVGSTNDIPERQLVPTYFGRFIINSDILHEDLVEVEPIKETIEPEFAEAFNIQEDELIEGDVIVDEETVKKLGFNKVGILPYFPPNR